MESTALKGHVKSIEGVERLANKNILTWSSDCTLRLWDIDGALLAVLDGHKRPIKHVSILYGLVVSYSDGGNYFELLFWDIKKALNARSSVIDIKPPVISLKPDLQLVWHGNSSLPILLDINIKLWISVYQKHELKNHKDSIVLFSDGNLVCLQFNWGAKRINFDDIQRSQEEIDLLKIAIDKAASAYLLGDSATSIRYFSFIIGHLEDKLAASLNIDNDEVNRINMRKKLALAFINRAIALEMNGDLQSATQDLEQSCVIYNELINKYLEPIDIEDISEKLARLYWSFGKSEFDKNNFELAKIYANNAINHGEKLRQRLEPHDCWPDGWAECLANSYNLRLLVLIYNAADNKKALIYCDKAIIIRERLRQRLEPKNQWPEEWAKNLFYEYSNRGEMHFNLYNFSDAFIDYSQAIELGKELKNRVKFNDSNYNVLISKLYRAYTVRCITGIGLLRLRSVPSDIREATVYMIMNQKLSSAYQKLPRSTIRPVLFLLKFTFILCIIGLSIYKLFLKLKVNKK